MTLDEAIKKEERIAEEKFNNAIHIMNKMKSDIALENAEEYKQYAEEHRQLAEWLIDYKRLLEQEPILDKIRAEVEKLDYLSIEDGSDGYDRYIDQQDVLQILDKYKADKEYEAKVITRGNCMMCGKELTEGLFFCKECETKAIQGRSEE